MNTFYLATKRILKASNGDDKKDIGFLCRFWETVIKNIEPWQELQKREISKVDLRENYIITQGVVIQALGVIGKYYYDHRKNINSQMDLTRLNQIDWHRTAKEWKYRVVRADGKILTSEKSIQLTANQIKKMLTIPLSLEEKNMEVRFNSEKKR